MIQSFAYHGSSGVVRRGDERTIHFAPNLSREPVAFDASAKEANVPRDLLAAIAVVEGGLRLPAHRTVDPDADAPVAGPLELRHGKFDSLARGATLVGTTELALRQDTDLALTAAAEASCPAATNFSSGEPGKLIRRKRPLSSIQGAD